MSTTMVHVRLDERIKAEAARALDAMGLSISDVVRMLLTRVASELAVPFDIKVPNKITRTAMKEADQGKGKTFHSADELFKDLAH